MQPFNFGTFFQTISNLLFPQRPSNGPALPLSSAGSPQPLSSNPNCTSNEGLAIIKHYEGCRLRAYRDIGGVWTIGYGDTGPDVIAGLEITQVQADQRLKRRLASEFEPGVSGAIAGTMTQCQFDALVCLTYNIGIGAFKSSTLARMFNSGDVQGAADQFQRWDKVNGQPVLGLRRRRCAERVLFLGADARTAILAGDNQS